MRILHVYHIYPAIMGGVSTAVYQITKTLSKRGHEVDVLTTNAYFNGERRFENEKGINVYRFMLFSERLSKQNIVMPNMEFVSWVKKMIRRYDCIHLHGYRNLYNIIIHHYARKYGVPYILQARGSLPRIITKRRLKWVYDIFVGYRLLRDASKVIALTQTEAQQYRDMGVPEEKIAIIPNGIDLSEYTNLPPKRSFRKKFYVDDDKKIVLYLGRIHKIKGLDILVRAYAYVVNKLGVNNVLLVIAGADDGYLGELEELLSQLRMTNNVLLTGPLYGKDKLEAYVDADVFVLPSWYDTFPNVVLEAYACSKPVIASNVGSISDIVLHGKTGLLFKPGNVQELAEAIVHMLAHLEEARDMGHRARKLVEEKFSIDKVVESLEALYEEILNGK